ncbi:MAG TPA: histidine phosphatase family protein [Limnochordales bacterium]
MRTRLLLTRHGETDWNVARRIQGWSDIPLNDHGREQARRLAARLRGTELAAIYTSDLARAMETAAIVSDGRPVALRVTETLRELSYGQWEGWTRDDLAAAGCLEWVQRWNAGDAVPPPPGGEPLPAAWERAERFLSCVVLRHPGETVLVVTHGGLLRLLVCLLQGLDYRAWGAVRTANTGLTEALVAPGEPALILRVNDTSHLEPLAEAARP